jgi:hypothetical protein
MWISLLVLNNTFSLRMESACALRLCVGQLHTSAVAYDPQTRSYRVARVSFSRVEVVGVLVKRADAQLKLG